MKKIRFEDKEFIFVSGSDQEGPIATEENYRNGFASYAYLFSDGRIWRHGKQIGTRDDIEWLGDVEVKVDDPGKAILNLLTHHSWTRGQS